MNFGNIGSNTRTNTIPFTGNSNTTGRTGHTPRAEEIYQSPGILDMILRRNNSSRTRQLEQLVDIESNLEIGSNATIDSLNPQELYNYNWYNSERTSLYRYRRIDDFHLPDGQYEIIRLISEQSGRELIRRNRRYIHLGLITIWVRALTRGFVGGKALLVLLELLNLY